MASSTASSSSASSNSSGLKSASAASSSAGNPVRVEIFDQSYNLRGTDEEYIRKLAEYVDAKMRTVSQQTSTVDTIRLAVLAALNIADEYHMLKRKQEGGTSDYLQRANHLSEALDEVLEGKEARRAG